MDGWNTSKYRLFRHSQLIAIIISVILLSMRWATISYEHKLRFDIIKRIKQPIKANANDNEPDDSDYTILVHTPNRPAKKCKIWLNNKPLPWSDNNGEYYRNIDSGWGGNARIPRNEFPEDKLWNAKGKIMEDDEICKEFVFFYLNEG